MFKFAGWTVQWSIATVLFIAVMAGAGYYVFNQAVTAGHDVVVPNIEGMSLTQAHTVLLRNGLEFGEFTLMRSSEVPENHIISQRPAANSVVRAGRRIRATVSAPIEDEPAPHVVRRPLADAQRTIEENGFMPGTLARIAHPAPRDTVIGQDPPANRIAALGSPIHLLVSDGPSRRMPLIMPNLTGRAAESARAELEELGLEVRLVAAREAGAEPGVVQSQEPAPDTFVQHGQQVTLYVPTESPAEDMWSQARFAYTVPGPGIRRLRIVLEDQYGNRIIQVPEREDYEAGLTSYPVDPGSGISFDFSYEREATVEVYLDDELVQTHRYESGAEPVITDYSAAP